MTKFKADINFLLYIAMTPKFIYLVAKSYDLTLGGGGGGYSVWGKTSVFHNFVFNSGTILTISLFLFDNDTYMASPQNGSRVCQWEAYFWKYFLFSIKSLFPVFSFFRKIDNYLRGASKKQEPLWSKQYAFPSQKSNSLRIETYQNWPLWLSYPRQ